jgi:hypothetical protein
MEDTFLSWSKKHLIYKTLYLCLVNQLIRTWTVTSILNRFDVPIQAWVSGTLDRVLTSNVLPINGIKTFSRDYGNHVLYIGEMLVSFVFFIFVCPGLFLKKLSLNMKWMPFLLNLHACPYTLHFSRSVQFVVFFVLFFLLMFVFVLFSFLLK